MNSLFVESTLFEKHRKKELADLTSPQKKQLQAFMEAWRYEQS